MLQEAHLGFSLNVGEEVTKGAAAGVGKVAPGRTSTGMVFSPSASGSVDAVRASR